MSDPLKRAAAAAALDQVEPGMVLGLGSGSTAEAFVDLLAERVSAGLEVRCIPTSERTAARARHGNIALVDFAERDQIDLTVDGADEIDQKLRLIKGGGGALLREKIVAHASNRMIVIADHSKSVDRLGAFPLPVEVVPFGCQATIRHMRDALTKLGMAGRIDLRRQPDGAVFQTDGGHLICDMAVGSIDDPEALAAVLQRIPGVVDHGLFIGLADQALLGGPGGVTILTNETQPNES